MQIRLEPQLSGPQNMQKDLEMFNAFEAGKGRPVLRIYSWQPACISLGYSQTAEKLIEIKLAKKFDLDIVRRPTGGGMVFHNEDEVTFALILPYDYPGLPGGLIPSFAYTMQPVVAALEKLGIQAAVSKNRPKFEHNHYLVGAKRPALCFSYPAEYELVVGEKKIVGAAQKRGRRGFLQQGSIFVSRRGFAKFEQVLRSSFEAELDKAVCIKELSACPVDFKTISALLQESFAALLQT